MVCSTCGYDNPREHRYCGMCGTPFPHRPLTVPAAQSTLAFSSTPLEVASSSLATQVIEPTAPAALELAEPPIPAPDEPPEPAPVLAESTETSPGNVTEGVVDSSYAIPGTIAHGEPEPPPSSPELGIVEEGPVAEATSQVAEEWVPSIEFSEPPAPQAAEEISSITEEPGHEVLHEAEVVAEESPVEAPELEPAAPIQAQEPTPTAVEAPPQPPEPVREETPLREIRKPAAKPPAPYIVPRPGAPPRQAPPARAHVTSARPAAVHPSPDSLPITPPPESAGMPTFQSVVDAAGAPHISPFEPPASKHADEDEELKEFVANFFYKPPDESIDELTMRSEVPVIDKEEPTQFHHASFDDDVAPPPEARAHTEGERYVPSISDDRRRPRFLEITDHPQSRVIDQPGPVSNSMSFLHLDDAAPGPGSSVPPSRSHWLLWSSLFALLLIFGGLGFLEGRAAMTHEFRGPIEIARDQYSKLRQRISQMTASTPAAPTTAANTSEPDKQAPAQSEPAPSNQPSQTPASSNPQPDTVPQSAASAPSTTPPATTPPPAQAQNRQTQPTPNQQAPTTDSGSATQPSDVANAAPPKPFDAPAPGSSNKPQPGQAELAKAMDASDPAAAAAWLWKATSRGNPEAPVRLADMYIKGKGVPHSCEQALVLLRSAAVKPNAPARNRLAALYANGTCVPRDRVRAYEFLAEALQADPTSEWAQQSQRELWNQMNPAERAEAQRFR